MSRNPSSRGALAAVLATIVVSSTAVYRAQDAAAPRNEVSITVKDGDRTITSNGIPNHATGQFPNPGNPNRIAAQHYEFRVTTTPKPAAQRTAAGGHQFGVAVNGVPFDPGTAELWNNDPNWHYEAPRPPPAASSAFPLCVRRVPAIGWRRAPPERAVQTGQPFPIKPGQFTITSRGGPC